MKTELHARLLLVHKICDEVLICPDCVRILVLGEHPFMIVRLVISALFGTLLAACSGSNRVAEILPQWANTSPRLEASQRDVQKKQVEGRRKPDTEPQAANKVDAQSLPEE